MLGLCRDRERARRTMSQTVGIKLEPETRGRHGWTWRISHRDCRRGIRLSLLRAACRSSAASLQTCISTYTHYTPGRYIKHVPRTTHHDVRLGSLAMILTFLTANPSQRLSSSSHVVAVSPCDAPLGSNRCTRRLMAPLVTLPHGLLLHAAQHFDFAISDWLSLPHCSTLESAPNNRVQHIISSEAKHPPQTSLLDFASCSPVHVGSLALAGRACAAHLLRLTVAKHPQQDHHRCR